MALDVEIKEQPADDPIEAAFEVLRAAHARGYRWDASQKDFGILLSIDALAPAERPWFFEICAMLKAPYWQVLWGQFRRCQEWGQANAPLMDPGWDKDRGFSEEILKERPCKECKQIFVPKHAGQTYCSNYCGAAEERRAMQKQREDEKEKLRRILAREPELVRAMNLGEEAPTPKGERPQLANVASPFAFLTQNAKSSEDKPVDLGTDIADTQGE